MVRTCFQDVDLLVHSVLWFGPSMHYHRFYLFTFGTHVARSHLASFKMWTYWFTQFYGLVYQCVIIKFYLFTFGTYVARGHLASFKIWTYWFTQFYGLLRRCTIIEFMCLFLEHMWHVATWRVHLSSTKKISWLGNRTVNYSTWFWVPLHYQHVI